jgi:hypothetical protein
MSQLDVLAALAAFAAAAEGPICRPEFVPANHPPSSSSCDGYDGAAWDDGDGGGGGLPLDGGRQLSMPQPISSGDCGDGGLSLDDGRQLSVPQPISGRRCGGGAVLELRDLWHPCAVTAAASATGGGSIVPNDVILGAADSFGPGPLSYAAHKVKADTLSFVTQHPYPLNPKP